MTEPDDSPLPRFRKRYVPPGVPSMPMTPESPLNLVIKRRPIRRTPPEPARSSRDTFLSNPLFDHESKEVGSDGATNESVSDFSSDDPEADDSVVTYGSHPDGSFEIYREGQLSQTEMFSTPLHLARHSGRVPLYQELEDKLIADKAARKSARLAAQAVAATASLLAIPIPELPNVAHNPPAVQETVRLAIPDLPNIAHNPSPVEETVRLVEPQRKITIPLMFQQSRRADLPVPPQAVPIFSPGPRSPVPSCVQVSHQSPLVGLLSFDSRIVPETPVPKLGQLMPSLQPSSGPKQSKRLKLPKNVRSIAVQTMSVPPVATASIAVQTCESDADLPVSLRDLRNELQPLRDLKRELQSFLIGLGF